MLIEYFDRHGALNEVDLIESEKEKRGQNTYEAENSKYFISRAKNFHVQNDPKIILNVKIN